jgi:hypothetical protein
MGWKGTWDNLTAYESQDAVLHQGETYVARIDVPAGTAPTNTTFWQLVAKKGEDGIDGTDGAQGEKALAFGQFFVNSDGDLNIEFYGDASANDFMIEEDGFLYVTTI